MDGALDDLFAGAIQQGVFPGASLIVGSAGEPFLERSWGSTHYHGGRPVGPHTQYDLASLTKPLVTTTLCLLAVGNGIMQLESPLDRLMPRRIVPASKTTITLFHLLNHCSGLPSYYPFYRDLIAFPPSERRQTLLSWILSSPLANRPGRHCQYSDLGFQLLGIVLEDLFERPLDRLASHFLLDPLHIHGLSYRRLRTETSPTRQPRVEESVRKANFAPTEACPWRQRLLTGEVHDENAYCLDGVAGHAGLFGAPRAIFQLLSHLLDVYRGMECDAGLKQDLLRLFWEKPGLDPEGTWALGYDTPSETGSSAGKRFSRHSVGHLGFTGTSFWIDLEREIIMILLSNRVHPTRTNERIKAFRPLAHDLVLENLNDD